VGNYEYGFFWYFYQDGAIEYEIKLTGILSVGAIAAGETRRYGTVVQPGVYAPIHQHFFSIRLDMALDGHENSVYEVNTEAEPLSDENPFGNAFYAKSTLLARESAAKRRINPETARYWRIVNPNATNRMGQPVSYKLMPMENCLPFNLPGSSLIKRAGFTTNHLWVTAYDPAEMHAAGQYPNQHAGGAGLPEWTAKDRPIENTDIVVWYTQAAAAGLLRCQPGAGRAAIENARGRVRDGGTPGLEDRGVQTPGHAGGSPEEDHARQEHHQVLALLTLVLETCQQQVIQVQEHADDEPRVGQESQRQADANA
jgi:hypothetical protein